MHHNKALKLPFFLCFPSTQGAIEKFQESGRGVPLDRSVEKSRCSVVSTRRQEFRGSNLDGSPPA